MWLAYTAPKVVSAFCSISPASIVRSCDKQHEYTQKIPPTLVLLLGLIAALLSVAGAFFRWCAIVAGMLTAAVVIVQFKTQGNITVKFTDSDWRKNQDVFEFSAGCNHGKGKHPNVAVYMPSEEGGYEEVGCDVRTLESGEVLIGASVRFDGEVRIS